MWIVRLALRRPYTFVVAAMLVLIMGILVIVRMPTDIFPDVEIPVIAVSFTYAGMPADEMEKRVVGTFERILTTTVNDIEHIDSQSLYGIGVVKVYFQQSANISDATAQVTAVSQTILRQMPPGMQPPLIIRYSASNVPILQLALSSDTLPEQSLFDLAVNQLRPKLVTIPGVQIPYPYGGKQRQVMVDIEPEKLYAYGVSPADVSNAVNAQSVILPAGTAKIGKQEYQVKLNSSPELATLINDMPIKTVNGTPVYIRDVANVRDGYQVQQSKVASNGKPAVLLSIMKNGGRVDAGRREQRHGCAAAGEAEPAARVEDHADVRPVGLRPRIGQGRHHRSGDRSWAHRHDDPAVPRLVAQHADCCHLDPAVDPRVDHHAGAARRDAEHDDARRNGAGGGHPR
jgi:multidrug efflux pump subunit AcrB